MSILDEHRQLVSDLWLDQPDADDEIERRRRAGRLDDADAERMRQFADEGYTSIALSDGAGLDAKFDAEIEQLWIDRPEDVALGLAIGGRISMASATEDDRTVGYRIADPHSRCPTARHLYLHPEIFRVVELILDQPAVSFQSLYFQWGSEQALHRDPMFVRTNPPSHLVAAWIATEDITEESGPLVYVPGSHRMPWFEFEPDDITARNADIEGRRRWAAHRAAIMAEMQLEPRTLTCPQGTVFIWHAGLLHGGAKVMDPQATRKSFVVHYSTAASYRSRQASMKTKVVTDGGERWVTTKGATTDLLEMDGCRGIDNPFRKRVSR